MNILHLCSYYIGNKLYMDMFKYLSTKKNITQKVYIPIRSKKLIDKNRLSSTLDIEFYYDNILSKKDRLFYHNKIRKQVKSVNGLFANGLNFDIIHAHTLFSDGGTAYELYKMYGIKYIVTVRNTDLNFYYKYAIHLIPYMYKILINASAIIFISEAYKNQMTSSLPKKILKEIENKISVIPNGINEYWHKNNKDIEFRKGIESNTINLLFIGYLNKNKNVETVIKACKSLIKKGYNINFDIVGDGPLEKYLKKISKKLIKSGNIRFYGYIDDKDKIKQIMDKNDIYVMPSIYETFGVVYIEAMSRGLPVVYSIGQGIDGFFESGEIGYAVKPHDTEMVSNVIVKINENHRKMAINCLKRSKEFNWHYITNKILKLYWKEN